MRNSELLKVWKKLDNCCEAIELLQNEGFYNDGERLLMDVVCLKNEVEETIESKTHEGSKSSF